MVREAHRPDTFLGVERVGPGSELLLDAVLQEAMHHDHVAADEFFALGDNRQASSDSRSFGPQPDERIIGKVIVRFWPFDRLRFFDW